MLWPQKVGYSDPLARFRGVLQNKPGSFAHGNWMLFPTALKSLELENGRVPSVLALVVDVA